MVSDVDDVNRNIDVDIDREAIMVACRYAMRVADGKLSRAEFLSEWTASLQPAAGEIWDTLHKPRQTNHPKEHSLLRNHLAKIGARSLRIEIPGPSGSSLHWYSMGGHTVIFQAFDNERWEIYTSLSAGNKVLLADACSALTNLATVPA